MHSKTLIWIGVAVGSTIGAWLGAVVSHGNFFSLLSIIGSIVGAFAGIWIGFKLSQYM
ncbi:MAG TPA: hypothetical protein VGO07_02405 [Candidatus Saccharimonadales bacterium]|jgi:outer membrane lipoprotein SlyB|nr:hypothetical protein [Candidatus Saccharimonadales bacterium]